MPAKKAARGRLRQLAVDQVGLDKQCYVRVNGKPDWQTVYRYRDALAAHPWKADSRKPGAFPPIHVVRAPNWDYPYCLLDGGHRLQAFASAGVPHIWAFVEMLPRSHWIKRAAELNQDSKRPLDNGDRQWVAEQMRANGFSDDEICDTLAMTRASFQRLMAKGPLRLTKAAGTSLPEGRANRQVGNDRKGFVKAPFAPVYGTANAQRALAVQGSVSAADAKQIMRSFIAVLECGVLSPADAEVAAGLAMVRRLINALLRAKGRKGGGKP